MTMRKLLDAEGLAAAIGCKKPTVRSWTRYTDIPRYKASRLVRFDLDEVLAWIKAGGPRRTSRQAARSGTASQ